VPARIPTLAIVRRDEGAELERFAKVDVSNLAGALLGDHKVAAVERSSEDGARVTLGGDGMLLPGAGRTGHSR
jgi:hypothetical protein